MQCTEGVLRRPRPAACTSSLPRATPDTPLAFSECSNDIDCTEAAHGFCAYGECKYGCVSDAECPSDQACFCGVEIGACVPANCHSDADCPSDLPCVAYVAPGFALPDVLACRSPVDECLTTPQCNSLNPRVSCRFQVDHRICYKDSVG